MTECVPESWEVLRHRVQMLMSPEQRARVRAQKTPPSIEVLKQMVDDLRPKPPTRKSATIMRDDLLTRD